MKMKRIGEKVFLILGLILTLATGMILGTIFSGIISNDSATYGSPNALGVFTHLLLTWMTGSVGKGLVALWILWLFYGSLLKKIAWKWTIFIAGIWWILFDMVPTSMHSYS